MNWYGKHKKYAAWSEENERLDAFVNAEINKLMEMDEKTREKRISFIIESLEEDQKRAAIQSEIHFEDLFKQAPEKFDNNPYEKDVARLRYILRLRYGDAEKSTITRTDEGTFVQDMTKCDNCGKECKFDPEISLCDDCKAMSVDIAEMSEISEDEKNRMMDDILNQVNQGLITKDQASNMFAELMASARRLKRNS